MGAENPTNGQTENQPPDQTRGGAANPRSTRLRSDPGELASGPYGERTRLCLFVPRHIVLRLEAHAEALGKSRDAFAAWLLGRSMDSNYAKRDKDLRSAYGVTKSGESPSED